MDAAESPRTAAAGCKDRGNRRFAARDDAGALRFYAQGIELLGDTATNTAPPYLDGKAMEVSPEAQLGAALHTNSAQALFRLRRYIEAIEHCNKALACNPAHAKATWRGATAAIEVGMHDVAVSMVDNGLLWNPECPDLVKLRTHLGPLPEHEGVGADDAGSGDEDFKLQRWCIPATDPPVVRQPPPPDKDKAD